MSLTRNKGRAEWELLFPLCTKKLCGACSAVSLCPSFHPCSFAQTDTSTLEGRVTDGQGGAVAGAKIRLTNQSTHAERQISSGDTGAYIFTLVPPGRYDIEATASGFKTFRDTAFQIDVAAPALLNITLDVGAVSESVTVEGVVSLLNTESAAQGTVIGEEKIVSLPLNGRQFIDLALLSPNVTIGGESVQQNQVRKNQDGGFSASGNRTNNNGFMLDGVSNLDPDYMSLSLTPILDTLAEFQVQTGQQNAEYGHAAGAQVNVVSKSGGNTVHGDAWEFVRNRVFDSRPFNLAQSTLPKYQRNQFGGTIGGPIRKNKLFVFGGYERLTLRQAAGGLTTVTVPTSLERQGSFTASNTTVYDALTSPRTPFAGDLVPQSRLNPLAVVAINAVPASDVPGTTNQYINSDEVATQDSHSYTARADYVATPSITMFGRYSGTHEGDLTPGAVPGRGNLGTALPQNGAYGVTWVLGPRSVNEFRDTLRPGDTVPIKGLKVEVVAGAGDAIAAPLTGAGQPNPLCGAYEALKPDPGENAHSLGMIIMFGNLRIADLGDLYWNQEHELACPINKLGTVDLYMTTHHGTATSGSPQMVHALHPKVAIMNNGADKGGSIKALKTLHDPPVSRISGNSTSRTKAARNTTLLKPSSLTLLRKTTKAMRSKLQPTRMESSRCATAGTSSRRLIANDYTYWLDKQSSTRNRTVIELKESIDILVN